MFFLKLPKEQIKKNIVSGNKKKIYHQISRLFTIQVSVLAQYYTIIYLPIIQVSFTAEYYMLVTGDT